VHRVSGLLVFNRKFILSLTSDETKEEFPEKKRKIRVELSTPITTLFSWLFAVLMKMCLTESGILRLRKTKLKTRLANQELFRDFSYSVSAITIKILIMLEKAKAAVEALASEEVISKNVAERDLCYLHLD